LNPLTHPLSSDAPFLFLSVILPPPKDWVGYTGYTPFRSWSPPPITLSLVISRTAVPFAGFAAGFLVPPLLGTVDLFLIVTPHPFPKSPPYISLTQFLDSAFALHDRT